MQHSPLDFVLLHATLTFSFCSTACNTHHLIQNVLTICCLHPPLAACSWGVCARRKRLACRKFHIGYLAGRAEVSESGGAGVCIQRCHSIVFAHLSKLCVVCGLKQAFPGVEWNAAFLAVQGVVLCAPRVVVPAFAQVYIYAPLDAV